MLIRNICFVFMCLVFKGPDISAAAIDCCDQKTIDSLLIESAHSYDFLQVQECILPTTDLGRPAPSQITVNEAFRRMVESSNPSNPLLHETLKIMLGSHITAPQPDAETLLDVLKSSVDDLDRDVLNLIINKVGAIFTAPDVDVVLGEFVKHAEWEYEKIKCTEIFTDMLKHIQSGVMPAPSADVLDYIFTNIYTESLSGLMIESGLIPSMWVLDEIKCGSDNKLFKHVDEAKLKRAELDAI